MFTDVIVLAGGIGERLWPLSTERHPKQFIRAEGGLSFFQMALRRALLTEPEAIIAVTRREFEALAAEHCRAFADTLGAGAAASFLRKTTVLAEPRPRNTAPAVHLALAYIARKYAGSAAPRSVLVLTSDHLISPESAFLSCCRKAAPEAAGGHLVCFAVPPAFPATGFGYLESGAEVAPGVREIVSFKEKPARETAEAFLAQGNYWWNSGMFAFSAPAYEAEVRAFTPALHAAFTRLGAGTPAGTPVCGVTAVREWDGLEAAYEASPAVSIDSAGAKKTRRARCVIADFEWDDIGSWDAFAERVPSFPGGVALAESGNCSVYSDIPVALCGVSNLIVAIRDGKAIVIRKGASALVRDAVRRLQDAPCA